MAEPRDEEGPLVLIVCTGNICRSPMAEALLRARLVGAGRGDIRVESAGTLGVQGPASDHAQTVVAQRGLDLRAHRGRPLALPILQQAGVILAMTREHARYLRSLDPEVAVKVHLFSELGGEQRDIADPYGGPLTEYEQTAAELEALIDVGWPQVVAWLGGNEASVG